MVDSAAGNELTLGPFADLSAEHQRKVLAVSQRRSFAAGQMIFRKGDPSEHVMVVQSGLVAVQVTGPDDRRLTLTMASREEVLGEMALAGSPRRTAMVIAMIDSEALMIETGGLVALRGVALEIDQVVMAVLADTVRRLTDQLVETTLLSQAVRLRRILLRLSRHYDGGRISLTQEQLAEVLGSQRTTITELLRADVEAGWLETGRGYVRIVDRDALRAASA
jgi:CRP/FNR family cyclic AMP-dependent transcriptional regulator